MKKLVAVMVTALLSLWGSSEAQTFFFGGSGNFAPHGSGNCFVGLSQKNLGALVVAYYGKDIVSADIVIYKYEGLVLSLGGSVSSDRTKDFISILVTPKLYEKGQWKLFGKVGINVDVGPLPNVRTVDRFNPIFGFGLRYR